MTPSSKSPLAETSQDRLRPWLLCGMIALVVARPLFPSDSASIHSDGMAMVMLWIALGIFWTLGAIVRSPGSKGTVPFSLTRKLGQSPPRKLGQSPTIRLDWTDLAVLLLILWYTVAALWAVAHGSPRPAINKLWEWIGMGLCFFLARQLIVTPREVRAVAAVMVALAAGLSGYGLYQCAFELPQTRAEYTADPDQALRDEGLWFPPGSREREFFESRLSNREPMATFALTNSLAAFLAPWMVILAGILGASLQNRKRLLLILLCFILIAACLLLTKSRSGYIACCVGLGLVWLFCRGQPVRIGWKLPAAALGIAALLLAAALAIDGPSVLGKAWYSFSFRLHYWRSSVQMIGDHPLVGCGPGNFQDVYTQYKLPEASEEIADPHNFLLEIWSTAGTPALVAFLGVLGCVAWAQRSGLRAQGSGDEGEGSEVRGQGSEGKEKGKGKRGKGEEEMRRGGERERGRRGDKTPTVFSQSPHLPISKSPNLYPFPASHSPAPPHDAWLHVLGGGIIGFLLSLPLGLLSAAPPGMAAVLIGLPLAAAATACTFGWIQDGRLPRLLPAVGVAVLLVDLLTTGGIGFPSVACTLWLLLALGLHGERPRAIRPFAAWAAFLLLMGLAVACYNTAYDPVLSCETQLRMAEREPIQAVEHLEAAAAADPLSAEPWRQLAAIEFDTWLQEPSADGFRRFEKANAQVLALAPNAAPAWLATGDCYFQAYSKMGPSGERADDDVLKKALNAYRRAVQLYPNNEPYRAKLAKAIQAAGDRPASRRGTP